jgi:hypothetical protein
MSYSDLLRIERKNSVAMLPHKVVFRQPLSSAISKRILKALSQEATNTIPLNPRANTPLR